MDTAFDDQFFVRVQFPVTQFFRDDLKASAFNISWSYIFQFYFHNLYPCFQNLIYCLHIQMFPQRCCQNIVLCLFECLKIHTFHL